MPAEVGQSLNSNFPPKPAGEKPAEGGSPLCPSPWIFKLLCGQQWVWALEAMLPTHAWLAAVVAAPGLAPVPMPSHCHSASTSSLWLIIGMKSFFPLIQAGIGGCPSSLGAFLGTNAFQQSMALCVLPVFRTFPDFCLRVWHNELDVGVPTMVFCHPWGGNSEIQCLV